MTKKMSHNDTDIDQIKPLKVKTSASKIFKLVGIAVLLVGLYFLVARYLNLACIQRHADRFKDWVDSKYLFSVFSYIIAMIIVVTTSLPISVPLALVGGFLFGMWPAALYTSIGIVIGALIAFIIFRYLLGRLLRRYFGDRIARLEKQVDTYGSSYLLIMHYSTVVPFFIINAVAALSGISLKTFLLYTVLGSLPLNLLYSFAGGQLGSIEKVSDIFSPPVVAALVLLVLIAIMPIVVKRFKRVVQQ